MSCYNADNDIFRSHETCSWFSDGHATHKTVLYGQLLEPPAFLKSATVTHHPLSPSSPLEVSTPRCAPYKVVVRELEDQLEQVKERLDRSEGQVALMRGLVDENRRLMKHNAETITRLEQQNKELEAFVGLQNITIGSLNKALRSADNATTCSQSIYNTPVRQAQTQHSLLTPPTSGMHRTSSIYDVPPPRLVLPENAMNFSVRSGSSLQSTIDTPRSLSASPQMLFKTPIQTSHSNVLPPEAFDIKAAEFSARFDKLWERTEQFGQTFAGVPCTLKDLHLEKRTRDYLVGISDKVVASYLLNSPISRPFMVAKAVNFYVTRDILKIFVVKGFDAAVDDEMGKIKKHLAPDSPPTFRNMIHTALANQMIRIKGEVGFREFRHKREAEHAQRLMCLIEPLIHDDEKIAISSLRGIINSAFSLSLDMYSTPFEFRFHIPESQETFDSQLMAHVDPTFAPDTPSMVRNNKVKLGITPITKFGDNSTTPARVRVIHFGKALLRVPNASCAPGSMPLGPKADQQRILFG